MNKNIPYSGASTPEDYEVVRLKITKGTAQSRLDTLYRLIKTGIVTSNVLPELLDLLGDEWTEQSRGSHYGPTGIDPSKDLTIALAAMEAIIIIGAPAIPALFTILEQSQYDHRKYFAILALGRLHVAEAVPMLEKMIREWKVISNQINFEQFDEFPLYEAAYSALVEINTDVLKQILNSLIDGERQDFTLRGKWASQKLQLLR